MSAFKIICPVFLFILPIPWVRLGAFIDLAPLLGNIFFLFCLRHTTGHPHRSAGRWPALGSHPSRRWADGSGLMTAFWFKPVKRQPPGGCACCVAPFKPLSPGGFAGSSWVPAPEWKKPRAHRSWPESIPVRDTPATTRPATPPRTPSTGCLVRLHFYLIRSRMPAKTREVFSHRNCYNWKFKSLNAFDYNTTGKIYPL